MRKYQIQYRKDNPKKTKARWKKDSKTRREKALTIINPELECKCGRKELLEIHHINVDGHKEKYKGAFMYQAIINGTRKTDDLEILCKPCHLRDHADKLEKAHPL